MLSAPTFKICGLSSSGKTVVPGLSSRNLKRKMKFGDCWPAVEAGVLGAGRRPSYVQHARLRWEYCYPPEHRPEFCSLCGVQLPKYLPLEGTLEALLLRRVYQMAAVVMGVLCPVWSFPRPSAGCQLTSRSCE